MVILKHPKPIFLPSPNPAYKPASWHTALISDLYIGKKDSTPILSDHYTYDFNRNLTNVKHQTASGASTISYEYDAIDQLTKEILADGTIKEYGYDGFGNRTSVKITPASGTVTTTSAQFNAGNQLVKFGNASISYDVDGNRTLDNKYSYQWNAANQLISITQIGQSTPFITYKYDNMGRRIEKTINGQSTRYYYDGTTLNLLYETNGNGNVVRQYIYSATGIRIAMKAQGQTLYYHYNSHGDVVAMTDGNNNVVARYEYDAWGNIIKNDTQGVAAENSFGYAWYMYDKETGLYYLIARYYHPEQGVFLSRDFDPGKTKDPMSQNGYSYANNNPVMNVDPDGNWALELLGSWGAEIIGGALVAIDIVPIIIGASIAAVIWGGYEIWQSRSKPATADETAIGPHTRYRTKDGEVTDYTTYDKDGIPRLQYRGDAYSNDTHYDKETGEEIDRPNVAE